MGLFESVPVEAVQLTPDNVREVAEWLVPSPGRSGYVWYEGSPARFRLQSGELAAAIGDWIIRLGSKFVPLSADEFERLFKASGGSSLP
jgi:hypothetical protein